MARTYITGFEMKGIADRGLVGDLTGVSDISGTGVSYDTGTVRTGAVSLKVAASSGAAGYRQNFVNTPADGWYRVYLRVTARPASTTRGIAGNTAAGNLNIALRSDGKLEYRLGTTVTGTSTTALTDTTKWYMVEWRWNNAGVTADLLRIEGVVEVTGTVAAGTLSGRLGASDTGADTYTVFYDDFSLDTATWPGAGNVALLLPVSDNADGSWTKPGGGTTVNATSVDNTPPIGIADTTSGANAENQIRNPTANDSYVANLTTYTNAGIAAADTVVAVMPFAIVGAPVTTGAKTGSLQLTANPAEGGATAFGTASARYHSGNNAGTFPTGWAEVWTVITNSPSVTKGNNPTLSLNITGGTASRIAMCCFMGAYVEYLPAVAALAPPIRSKSIHNALVR